MSDQLEVQREVARKMKEVHEEISELRESNEELQNELVKHNHKLKNFLSLATCQAFLIDIKAEVDPLYYTKKAEVLVVDKSSPHYNKGGVIADVDDLLTTGKCSVQLFDGQFESFHIGVDSSTKAQIKLIASPDGSHYKIFFENKYWSVQSLCDDDLQPGDLVQINPETKNIVARTSGELVGCICSVTKISDEFIEVENKSDHFHVYNFLNVPVEVGDRVLCDHGVNLIVRKVESLTENRFNIKSELTEGWDDIGGLEKAKKELRGGFETPISNQKVTDFYGKKPIRGALLYGPPGCGKTLLARVLAKELALLHGKEYNDAGYIYVKGPELLDKYVGVTESKIRNLFADCRKYFRDHGYKAVLVIDEADALMPERGSRRTSDIADTIVPMFLSEMDGVDTVDTDSNPVVILMTNRSNVLDPAITRPGRISLHIKIERPNEDDAIKILDLHTKDLPFKGDLPKKSALTLVVSDFFSKSRDLYRINNEHLFTLGDTVSGAMLESLVELAKNIAIERDIKENTLTGVSVDDFRDAINVLYDKQRGLNHSFDIEDFLDKKGILTTNLSVEKCFSSR